MSIPSRALQGLCRHHSTKTATSPIALIAHLNPGKSCPDPLLYDIRRHYQKSQHRCASSSSSTRWKTRQAGDHFAKEAKIQGLKSRAAFKLLQINDKYKLFRRGDTVVDLGYAPGSWSQVAINRTQPNGRVIGVDILPAQPPRGVSTIQGDFLSPEIQAEVRSYVLDHDRGRAKRKSMFSTDDEPEPGDSATRTSESETKTISQPGYLESERQADLDLSKQKEPGQSEDVAEALSKLDLDHMSKKERDEAAGRVVDVVLSDMCEPWEQTSGFHKRSISDPYRRMMNTSGNPFRDHAGSMDLCIAAMTFAFDTLKTGGHFVAKFYQGGEDKLLEKRLKRLFEKVHRDKPEASRKESREGYFVALRRKENPTKEEVLAE